MSQIVPIVASVAQEWSSYAYTTFNFVIGHSAQYVRLLPATGVFVPYVQYYEACAANDTTCIKLHGEVFNPNASNTWNDYGFYEMIAGTNINLTKENDGTYDYAQSGLDTIGFGLSYEEAGNNTLSNQFIGAYQSDNIPVGLFPLSPWPFNLSNTETQDNFEHQTPSILANLRNHSLIPSLSWGYTAGASYRGTGKPGSLILGGYDSSRIVNGSGLSFTMNADVLRELVVGVRHISTLDRKGQNISLSLTEPSFYAYIDTATPEMWLPLNICEQFEKQFNLTWNKNDGYYYVNDTMHQNLLSAQLNITFELGANLDNGSTMDISLPYSAFALQKHDPKDKKFHTGINYFPLRRATKMSEYTLGRAFMQEAYMIADYERYNFSLHQAAFDQGPQNVVPILQVEAEKAISKHSRDIWDHIAIIAGPLFVLVLVFTMIYFRARARLQRMKAKDLMFAAKAKDDLETGEKLRIEMKAEGAPEVVTDIFVHENTRTPAELGGKAVVYELSAADTSELYGSQPPRGFNNDQEMECSSTTSLGKSTGTLNDVVSLRESSASSTLGDVSRISLVSQRSDNVAAICTADWKRLWT